MDISSLDSKFENYQELLSRHEELYKQQEDLLTARLEASKPYIEWYRKKGLVFTHPTIKFQSNRGPILGFDNEDNSLFVYNPDKGLLEVDLRTKETKNTFALRLIEEGYFEDAMKGLDYLETMIDGYVQDLGSLNFELESQLAKYE